MLYTLGCAAWRLFCLPTLIYMATTIFVDIIQERSADTNCILYLYEFIRDIGFRIYAKLLHISKSVYTNLSSHNDKLIILEPILTNSILLVGASILYFLMFLLINSTQGVKSFVMTLILLPPLSCITHGYIQPMIQNELYEDVPWFSNNINILKFIRDKQNTIGTIFIFAILWILSLSIQDIDSLLGLVIKDLLLSGVIFIGINFIAAIIYIVVFFISIDGEIWSLGYEEMCKERLNILASTNNVEVIEQYSNTQQQTTVSAQTNSASTQNQIKDNVSQQEQTDNTPIETVTEESQNSVFQQGQCEYNEQQTNSVFLNNQTGGEEQ